MNDRRADTRQDDWAPDDLKGSEQQMVPSSLVEMTFRRTENLQSRFSVQDSAFREAKILYRREILGPAWDIRST